jgi:hypothetical protein
MRMPDIISLKNKMGRSPIGGYALFDQGDSVEMQAIRGDTTRPLHGGLMRTMNLRLPTDPEDLATVVAALLRHSKGELSVQAFLVALANK